MLSMREQGGVKIDAKMQRSFIEEAEKESDRLALENFNTLSERYILQIKDGMMSGMLNPSALSQIGVQHLN